MLEDTVLVTTHFNVVSDQNDRGGVWVDYFAIDLRTCHSSGV